MYANPSVCSRVSLTSEYASSTWAEDIWLLHFKGQWSISEGAEHKNSSTPCLNTTLTDKTLSTTCRPSVLLGGPGGVARLVRPPSVGPKEGRGVGTTRLAPIKCSRQVAGAAPATTPAARTTPRPLRALPPGRASRRARPSPCIPLIAESVTPPAGSADLLLNTLRVMTRTGGIGARVPAGVGLPTP